nr:4'-phosphopantetheinyl transferase superfamily protein [Pelagicoccus albus]
MEFAFSPLGKPELASLAPAENSRIHFNLSHSGSSYLLGVRLDSPIGVDIEDRRSINGRDELVERFFHPTELQEFQSLPEELKDEAFLLAWTRKEAVLKATGEGLSAHLDSLQVTLDPDKDCQLRSIDPKWGDVNEWHLSSPPITPESICAIASHQPIKTVKARYFFEST